MSKGTPRYAFRLPPDLIAAVEEVLLSRNLHTAGELWTLSDWVRVALVEKLDKVRRGRNRKGGVRHPLRQVGVAKRLEKSPGTPSDEGKDRLIV